MKKFLIFLFISVLPGCSSPDNFDDCILENLKGVGDPMATKLIYRSCRNKFPEISDKMTSGKD